jgi:putative heme iron utilization protein
MLALVTSQEHRPSTEPGLTLDGVPAPSHAERARSLVAGQRTGALSTLTEEGFPYGSYVTFAVDGDAPVFLVSTMAAHTKNLQRDGRASLLVHEQGAADPLANGRVTLVGRCSKLGEATTARDAFLQAHPQSSYYVDFKDFAFWKLAVESVRYIGGYGRMSWVELDAWCAAEADPIVAGAAAIIEHMNDDHADANLAYARAFTRATAATSATMTGVDRYGFELSVETDAGPRPARIGFPAPVAAPADIRKAMVDLLKSARAELGEG